MTLNNHEITKVTLINLKSNFQNIEIYDFAIINNYTKIEKKKGK